ncbi:hypothetical protein INT47_000410 [Mucor saturninus]|uniref:Uncharacterized protein n=1 Tax=Mucor saturninus TaxID=64648 RepID=A0A8H7QNL7_9FUNG|nr:hypothetical protein INT47_000410 [Mucor saturninus]
MSTLPPPVPIHKSPLPALSKSTHQNNDKKVSYLGRKRHGELLTDDGSSSDESETDNYNTEEHKFWQVHSSTTIISPSGHDYNTSIQMSYVSPKNTKKQRISLAIQVHNILGSTFDAVDKEIEQEWESSRVQLRKSLIILPNLSSN